MNVFIFLLINLYTIEHVHSHLHIIFSHLLTHYKRRENRNSRRQVLTIDTSMMMIIFMYICIFVLIYRIERNYECIQALSLSVRKEKINVFIFFYFFFKTCSLNNKK
jgi:hypothetical protein